MTNLEFYKDEIIKQIKKSYDDPAYTSYGQAFCAAICRVYTKDKKTPFYGVYYEQVLDWLLEEHKEPIKLQQWEKDLVGCVVDGLNIFESYYSLMEMKRIGHFKGVTNTSMTLKEILENCEVIENE